MVPSRLAFLQVFERDLSSGSLRTWFEAARDHDAVLADFTDPAALRRFLHTDNHDIRKPHIWRALIRSFQIDPEPAKMFVLGLLEPALGHLIDKLDGLDLDSEDLWQETIACALRALANPRLQRRRVVLLGLIKDTQKLLSGTIRRELREAKGDDGLPDVTINADLEGPEADFMLAVWCRRAGVSKKDEDLIRATRIQGLQLSRLAAHGSPTYNRLKLRRHRAEQRLRTWLMLPMGASAENSM